MLLWTIEDLLGSSSLPIRALRKNLKGMKEISKDKISYGGSDNQYLLVFSPKTGNRKDGIVFFIHGGGWRMFNPEIMQFIGFSLAEYGFPTVMPGYRLAPRYQFPAQMEDVFSAFKKCMEISDRFGLNYKKTIAAGQSAGGELAGLLVFNRKMQKMYDIDQEYFRGMISISGPLDITFHSKNRNNEKMYYDFAPTEESRKEASPIGYITGSENIPVLCLHGNRDPIVEINRSESFVNRINEKKKGLAVLRVIKNRHHSDISEIYFNRLQETEILIRWIEEKLFDKI